MMKPSSTKLDLEKKSSFQQFHEMFQTHINNMGWEDIMLYQATGQMTDINLTMNFGQVTFETSQQAHRNTEANSTAEGGKIKLKCKAMYTWLFSSCEEKAQRILVHESETHHDSGPIAWEVITEHATIGNDQAVHLAQNQIHTMSLEQFDFNVSKMMQSVKDNLKNLQSNEHSETSMASNLFCILKKAPSEDFKHFIGRRQDEFDEGGTFRLESFIRACVTK